MKREGRNDTSITQLTVAASTHYSKKAVWSKYREMKIAAQKEGNTKEKTKEIQFEYEKTIGLTMFNSKSEEMAIQEWLPRDI